MNVWEPEFDRDGYPTDGTLAAIAAMPNDEIGDFVIRAWSDYGKVILTVDKLTLITGGWSGNESIIEAVRR